MNLLNLAPDIQEDLLFTLDSRGGLRTERALRKVAMHVYWQAQRDAW